MTRFVACAVAALLLLAATTALSKTPAPLDRSRVRFAQLELPRASAKATRSSQRWALVAWAQEVRLRTSIEIAQEPARVSLMSDQLFAHPLLYWAGSSAFARLPDAAVARLRRHLSTGGVLIVDNTGRSGPDQGFDRSIRRCMRRVFGRPFSRLPANHVLYRSFYRLRAPYGRHYSVRFIEGQRVGKRFAVLYVRNDLQGAFARLPHGGPARRVIPGGEAQREQAYRFGINLVMYALCLGYKDDHAHVTELLKKRRGQ